MSIGFFRDIIICLTGLVATGVLIFIAILLYRLYHRTRAILDSLESTSTTMKGMTSFVGDEVLKPVVNVLAMAQGVRQGVETFTGFFKKQEGGKND